MTPGVDIICLIYAYDSTYVYVGVGMRLCFFPAFFKREFGPVEIGEIATFFCNDP